VTDSSRWLYGQDALDQLDDQWDALALRAPDPFSRSEWLRPWYEAFGGDRTPALLRIERAGRLVGGLALLRDGDRLTTTGNDHTPVLAPLHADRDALDGLAEALARADAGVVMIEPLPVESEELGALAAASRSDRRIVVRGSTYTSPFVLTRGSYDAYRAGRDGWRTLERRARKSAREHELVVRAIELQQGDVGFLEEGLRVEASGWKGAAGTAILSRAETARFYRTAAAGFARRGALALSGLWLDGRLVAFDLALLHANRYWMLKTGYDESFAHLTPGLVLRRAVVERCFDRALDTHELLGADHRWKQMFATDARRHCMLGTYRTRPRPLARLSWRLARLGARSLYRRAHGLRRIVR
jgi:Acetyltransferase (GNAT) domain